MEAADRRIERPSAVRSLRIDDVVATYVVDGVLVVRPAELLPKVPTEHWSDNEGLLDAHARMVMSVGGLLIEREGRALLIDAGAGPTSGRTVVGPVHSGRCSTCSPRSGGDETSTSWPSRTFTSTTRDGLSPASRWSAMKTFPNASYMVSEQEWAPYEHGEDAACVATSRDLIRPLAACRTGSPTATRSFPVCGRW
jgi:hypothetical protein